MAGSGRQLAGRTPGLPLTRVGLAMVQPVLPTACVSHPEGLDLVAVVIAPSPFLNFSDVLRHKKNLNT